ncbi:MAG: glutaredoxin family protein [Candidatus Competibacterales bacterium]|nr:glutaredoxin family protein [Candidatus Competibacterales bacterium]
MDEPVLYMTVGCHLCEEAQYLLIGILGQPVQEVDIADDQRLMEHYGVRIPVLRSTDGAELDWPFDTEDARALLRR